MGLKFSRENTFDITCLHVSEHHHPFPPREMITFINGIPGSEFCGACPSILVQWIHSDPPTLTQNSTPCDTKKQ